MVRAALLSLLLVSCARARAEGPAPDISEELRLIESTERGEDPLGIDESTGRGLDEAARALPKPKPYEAPPVEGPVLTALDAVSETSHAVRVSLEQGLALVEVEAHFTSRSERASEVAYRLPLPEGAVVSAVRLCGAACRDAVPGSAPIPGPDGGPLPFVWAAPIRDARGHALSLLLSSVARDAPLSLTVRYVAEAPVRGGRARFTLPARGEDPRLAPTALSVRTRYVVEPFETALTADPRRPLPLVVTLRREARASERVACRPAACRRSFAASPGAPLSTRPVWLLLDASPSMEGPARGRVDMVLAALLSVLPPDTPVHAFAFAQRALDLGRARADSVALAPLSDALLRDLGPATRPTSVLALARPELARERPRVVLLSDGFFDGAAREQRALTQLGQHGAELWFVALGERPVRAPGHASVLALGSLADEAQRTGDLSALEDALRAIASPMRGGARAGEQRVNEGAGEVPTRAGAPWLAFWSARHAAPWQFRAGERSRGAAQVAPFAALPAPVPPADTGMPKESVLNMLRTQLVPKARGCLRSDRRGRGDYAVALTFHALFAHREISDVNIEGPLTPALVDCLEHAVDGLRVPAFSGRIRVRYPIHTEREPPPPVIELEPEVDAQVERVIGPRSPGRVPVLQ